MTNIVFPLIGDRDDTFLAKFLYFLNRQRIGYFLLHRHLTSAYEWYLYLHNLNVLADGAKIRKKAISTFKLLLFKEFNTKFSEKTLSL